MATFFSKPEIQYKPLNDENDIVVADFLQSCEGIVQLSERGLFEANEKDLGKFCYANYVAFFGTAFFPVKNDISGNVAKIRRVYEPDPVKYATIKKILDSEAASSTNKMGVATDALLWLKRGLEFLCVFLDAFVIDHRSGQPSDTLVGVGQHAYGQTLKRHHNFIEQSVFAVIIRATPWRKDFLKTMADGRPDADEECITDLERYMPPMKANVSALMDTFHERGLEEYDSKVLCS